MTIAGMENVVKRFGQVQALNHVSFTMKQGEILGLLGPNGAGKTTAIRVLAGLVPADSGEVTVFGERQDVNNTQLKQSMGLVTQEVAIFEDLSAEENLRFFGGLYGVKGKALSRRVQETLEFTGLAEHSKKAPGKYSGGMRRRLNIACALVHEPQFLIMDEPTVGIDPQSRSHILESVKQLAKRGVTVLYTSHYMEEVQAIADCVVIMDEGRVIASGTLEDLISRIQYEETIRISVTNPTSILEENLRAIQGVKSVAQNGADFTIVSGAGAGNLNRVLAAAQQSGAILAVTADKPTLEDVFLTLTGKKLRDEEAGA